MQRTILVVLVATLACGACASTRNTPCETLNGMGRANAQQQAPRQTNENLDFDAINQVGDTGAGQVAAPTKSTVELQVNNNAHAPQVQDIFGMGGAARRALEHVSAGEAAVARTLSRTEKRLDLVEVELDAGVAAPERVQQLLDARAVLVQEREACIARLDAYAAEKARRYEELAGQPLNLPALESINLIVNASHHVGTDKQMTDAEAESISTGVQAALLRQVPVVTPATPGGGGS